MKRGEPPKRKTPIARSTKPLKRTAIKRKPIVRVERKKKPPLMKNTDEHRFKRIVRARAHGECEARIAHDCTGRYTQAHHVLPRGRGQGIAWLHSGKTNGIGVCNECHTWIHSHITWAEMISLLDKRPMSEWYVEWPQISALQRYLDVALSGRT